MKFIYFLLLFYCLMGSLKAQTKNPAPAPNPTPLVLGKNDTIKTYLTVNDSGK
jgi:hypothetical protein